ncbi:MAG: ABC transporter permease [Planctomycetota bacterium]|jgi:putative ABC transport system permease protein
MQALKNLSRRKVRSSLTVIGVAIGIATVVALIAVARGLRRQFNDFFAVGNAHLVLTRKGAADPFISYLPDGLIERLAGMEGIAAAHPFLFAAHQIPMSPFFFFFGTTEGSPFLAQMRVVEGRSVFEPGLPPRPICIGQTAAEHLKLTVDSTLRLGNEDYMVVGIFESSTPLLDAGSLLPFEAAQRLAGLEGKMSSALVHLAQFNPDTLAASEAALEAALPEVEATAPAEFTTAFDEFDLAEQGVTVVTVLAVFVGGIGVMNTMLMSVFERTREIGILQAVGWSKGMILRQVLAEGLVVSLLGGPLGIGLGILAVEIVGSFGELSWVAGDYGTAVFAQAMTVAMGMGLVGAAYPALRAVRITPIEALRHE